MCRLENHEIIKQVSVLRFVHKHYIIKYIIEEWTNEVSLNNSLHSPTFNYIRLHVVNDLV